MSDYDISAPGELAHSSYSNLDTRIRLLLVMQLFGLMSVQYHPKWMSDGQVLLLEPPRDGAVLFDIVLDLIPVVKIMMYATHLVVVVLVAEEKVLVAPEVVAAILLVVVPAAVEEMIRLAVVLVVVEIKREVAVVAVPVVEVGELLQQLLVPLLQLPTTTY